MNRLIVVSIAVFVTLLWSTSYIINKIAFMDGIGPFMLSGLRYLTAVLTIFIIKVIGRKKSVSEMGKSTISFRYVLILGILGFFIAQGLQYGGQSFLTPTQSSLLLNIGNTFFVVLVDLLWLREIRNVKVLIGIAVAMSGTLVYYYPWHFEKSNLYGVALMLISSIGYAANLTLTRFLLQKKGFKSTDLVMFPMLIGAIGMIAIGLILEGIPVISMKTIVILIWLGAVNGGLAFSLWTWTQKYLSAYNSNLINNLMLLEVVLLDIAFFGRNLTALQVLGLSITGVSVLMVQLIRQRQPQTQKTK